MSAPEEERRSSKRLNAKVLRDHGDIIGHTAEVEEEGPASRRKVVGPDTLAETESAENVRVFSEAEKAARHKHFEATGEAASPPRKGKRVLQGPTSSDETKKVKVSKEREEQQKRIFGDSSALPMTNDENFYQENTEAPRPVTAARAARLKNMSSSNIFSDEPEEPVKKGKKHRTTTDDDQVAAVLREV